ncbi:hypothetical protein ACF3N7_06145 [Cruoricaptor ignavus]|uniref:hypothetical protein n=1 Tax=Cruoricaptor ignavus TaxID=1118202 RepID=UPI00370DA510
MKSKLARTMYRRQSFALVIFALLVLGFQLGFSYYKKKNPPKEIEVEFLSEQLNPEFLAEFDPNDLSAEDWQKLGFSKGQVKTILNYKNVVGGSFKSKQQFKKCYAISAEMYAQLEPYILLPESGFSGYQKREIKIPGRFNPDNYTQKDWEKMGFSERQSAAILKYKNYLGGSFVSKEKFKECFIISQENYAKLAPYLILPEKTPASYSLFAGREKRELKIPGRFNPDDFSQQDWEKMGFSERQSAAILKYKNYLGGSFVSKEKFRECFIISDENYAKLEPYLILPEKTPEDYSRFPRREKPKVELAPFDPNLLDLDGWKSLGFSEKQAQVIVNYRDRNLRGSFRSLEDIRNCFVINEDKYWELKPFIRLNPENFSGTATRNPQQHSAQFAPKPAAPKGAPKVAEPESLGPTDFAKVDLNQITFKQLREFGFSEKDAAMLLSFRKKLGGFVNTQQVVDTYEIDKDLAKKLVNSTQLNTSGVQKYSLVDAPEDWLKTHPYFKYSADKIIFYRLSHPDEKKIWKFLQLKPEYEARMRLYTK